VQRIKRSTRRRTAAPKPGREKAKAGCTPLPHLTTHWSGRPTAQAQFSFVALSLWAAAHRER